MMVVRWYPEVMVCTSYNPVGYCVLCSTYVLCKMSFYRGVTFCRYYYAMVDDPRGNLVEASIQLLFILLDYIPPADIARTMQLRQQAAAGRSATEEGAAQAQGDPRNLAMSEPGMGNLFCSFISRLHQNDVSVSVDV